MRPHFFVLAVLAGAAALAGCTRDTADTREFITMEPADVTPPAKITRYADANRDGQVTREEAKADSSLAASFDRYDLDRNDKLDRGEFARLEDERRDREATRASQASAATGRWATDERPGGYFGPPPGESD